jgi:pimeloyl-ACP methyl ester carboxylesterase
MKISINKSEIFYRLDGHEGAPVVMLAHAMGASHRNWDWQVAGLMKNWRVLRYDLAGHGDSGPSSAGYSIENYVSDAVGLMDALGLEKVHFVGISAGGIIGQGLGNHHGARLHSLAVCNSWSQSTLQFRRLASERRTAIEVGGMAQAW